MDFWTAVVALTALGVVGSMFQGVLNTIRAIAESRHRKVSTEEVLTELRALRGDIQQLRSENNSTILALDSALNQVDRRFSQLELGGSRVAEEPALRVGRYQ